MRITGPVLEANRRRRTARRLEQRPPCLGQRRSRVLLVAMIDGCDLHRWRAASLLQRGERRDDDDVAALHIDHAGAARGRVVQPLESLEWAARLEDGIEMSDEQELRSGAWMLGDEMAGALERRTVDPTRCE